MASAGFEPANSGAAAVSEPALYRLLTFQVPNLMSLFHSLGRNIPNMMRFYGEELLAPRPNPKLEDHPLSASRDCIFNIFAAALDIGGRSSIPNLRTRHAVVTGTHLSWLIYRSINQKCMITKLIYRKILQEIRKQFYVLYVICTVSVLLIAFHKRVLRKYFVTCIIFCNHKLSSGEIMHDISPKE
jgi:hypothetical protein